MVVVVVVASLLGQLFTGVDSNQDLIWCVKIGVYYGFLSTSWVLTTMPPRARSICHAAHSQNKYEEGDTLQATA